MLAQGRVRTRVSSGSSVDRYHLATMTAFSKLRGQKARGKSHPPSVPCSGDSPETVTAIATWNLLFLISNPPGVYKPPAVPSGAAQGAHYPAAAARARGARTRDIQAVTAARVRAYGQQFSMPATARWFDHGQDFRSRKVSESESRRVNVEGTYRPGPPSAAAAATAA